MATSIERRRLSARLQDTSATSAPPLIRFSKPQWTRSKMPRTSSKPSVAIKGSTTLPELRMRTPKTCRMLSGCGCSIIRIASNRSPCEADTRPHRTNCIARLSEELYSKPTHFILELVQNADDNSYEMGIVPKLSFLYRQGGSLWVGCNEAGFSEDNVRSICRIASSTKNVENNRKGYIGEKGIGFKSVFKVNQQPPNTSHMLTGCRSPTKFISNHVPFPLRSISRNLSG